MNTMNHNEGWMSGWGGGGMWFWTVIGTLVAVLLVAVISKLSCDHHHCSGDLVQEDFALAPLGFAGWQLPAEPFDHQRARSRPRSCGGHIVGEGKSPGVAMAFVEEHYPTAVPFFALCMFAGIRPCLRTGEILRLQPSHFKPEANLIRIDGEVSKVREPRNVAIQPNLAAWLQA
jgi:hypothetical protein